MLALTKKTDYALIALMYLAEHRDGLASAREIAEAFSLPTALMMNILKTLHHAGLLISTRGTKGGYRLTADLSQVSMLDLIQALEGPVRLADCVIVANEAHGCGRDVCKVATGCPVQGPIRSLHEKIVGFLKEVPLASIVSAAAESAGRRELQPTAGK